MLYKILKAFNDHKQAGSSSKCKTAVDGFFSIIVLLLCCRSFDSETKTRPRKRGQDKTLEKRPGDRDQSRAQHATGLQATLLLALSSVTGFFILRTV